MAEPQILRLPDLEPLRSSVEIGGHLYELLDLADIGPRQAQWLRNNITRLLEHVEGEQEMDEAREAEAVALLDQVLARIMPKLSKQKRARIPYVYRLRILMHWVAGFMPAVETLTGAETT